jgi:hypothetical protein
MNPVEGEVVMGYQRRLKQFRRELRQVGRKNQRAEAVHFPDQYDVFPAVEPVFDEQNVELDMNEEFDELYEIVMPNLPFFSGIGYEPWATEIKKLLWFVDLLHYDQEDGVNFYDKRRGEIALQLIMSAVDENILSSIFLEFGEVSSPKIFWDILEMKKWSEDVENDDCVEHFVAEIETGNDCIEIAMIDDESVYVADCDNENENLVEEDLFEGETYEVRFDEDNSSNEEWSKLMHEKHLIDELLFGEKNGPLAYTNQVEDNFIVAEKEEKEEEQERNQKALLEEKTENSKNCFDILMNAFECAGFAKEECDVKHLGEVPHKFDEELEFIEEWLQKPYYDECKETLDYDEECMDTEEEDCITDIEIESVFRKWSPEEIKYYYELMLQESLEQDSADCIQKWEQHIYVELEAFANIKDKCSQDKENAEVLRTKNNNQKSNSKMRRNKVKRAMKQNRVKMKHIWRSKPRKKLHLYHYLRSRKVKMKLLICKLS